MALLTVPLIMPDIFYVAFVKKWTMRMLLQIMKLEIAEYAVRIKDKEI